MHGDVVVIEILTNELRSAEDCYAIRDEARTCIQNANSKSVLFDFGKVEFMGSVAFLAFLALRREELVNRIVCFNVSDSIQQMLAACKLIPTDDTMESPFEIVESLAQGLKRFAN